MNLIEKYYKYAGGEKPSITKSEEIIFDIIDDLTDRRGLRQEWEDIDDEVKEEIIKTWIDLVDKKI